MNICGKAGVQVHFKGNNTVKDLMDAPNKGGVIYMYRCSHPGCTMEYIGETCRNFGDRYQEHLRAPSPSLTIPKLQVIPSNWITSP